MSRDSHDDCLEVVEQLQQPAPRTRDDQRPRYPVNYKDSVYASIGDYCGWLLIEEYWVRVCADSDLEAVAKFLKREGDTLGIPIHHRQVREHPRLPLL